MKKHFLFFFLFISLFLQAQEPTNNRGTIKVAKKGIITKVQFDNVYYRLIGIDQYGNVRDSAVVEFGMAMTIKGIAYKYKVLGPGLSIDMQQTLAKCDQTSKVFFTDIKVKDKNGEIHKMPNFQYNFAYSDQNSEWVNVL